MAFTADGFVLVYMRSLNEFLARRANEEDKCTGRFWEGRYKSQALLDEGAVLTCMSYVDLNPIRAGIAKTPESSDFTSIQQRIQTLQQQEQKRAVAKKSKRKTSNLNLQTVYVPLMPLVKQSKDPHKNAIGYTALDYLELVDWAGGAIRKDKSGWIEKNISPILERLNLQPDAFFSYVTGSRHSNKAKQQQRQSQPNVLGSVEKLKAVANQLNQKFIRGIGDANRLYPPPGLRSTRDVFTIYSSRIGFPCYHEVLSRTVARYLRTFFNQKYSK